MAIWAHNRVKVNRHFPDSFSTRFSHWVPISAEKFDERQGGYESQCWSAIVGCKGSFLEKVQVAPKDHPSQESRSLHPLPDPPVSVTPARLKKSQSIRYSSNWWQRWQWPARFLNFYDSLSETHWWWRWPRPCWQDNRFGSRLWVLRSRPQRFVARNKIHFSFTLFVQRLCQTRIKVRLFPAVKNRFVLLRKPLIRSNGFTNTLHVIASSRTNVWNFQLLSSVNNSHQSFQQTQDSVCQLCHPS